MTPHHHRSHLVLATLAAAAITLMAACAGSAPGVGTATLATADATVDPVGAYQFTITDDGKPVGATMTVTGRPGSYTGQIKTETRPALPISMLAASGSLVIATADSPRGVLVVRMRFSGDSVTGNWALLTSGGSLRGVRTSRAP